MMMDQDIESKLYSGQIDMNSEEESNEVMLCDICGKEYSLSDMACYNICLNCIDSVRTQYIVLPVWYRVSL